MLSWILWVVLINYGTWGCSGNPWVCSQWVRSVSGLRAPWACGCHLKWGQFVGTVPLLCEVRPNSWQLVSKLHPPIWPWSGFIVLYIPVWREICHGAVVPHHWCEQKKKRRERRSWQNILLSKHSHFHRALHLEVEWKEGLKWAKTLFYPLSLMTLYHQTTLLSYRRSYMYLQVGLWWWESTWSVISAHWPTEPPPLSKLPGIRKPELNQKSS